MNSVVIAVGYTTMQKLILCHLLKQRINLNAKFHQNNQTEKYRFNDSMTSLVLDIGNLSDKYKLSFTYYWQEQT